MKWVNPMGIPADFKRRLGLGQTTSDPNLDAWAQLVTALRDSQQESWNAAKRSYLALKKIRGDLGLDFMVEPGGEGNPKNVGAWAPDLDQQAVDLQAMNEILINAANDVLASKRQLVWNPQIKDFGIQALPNDIVRIETVNNKAVLVLSSTGASTHGTGTIGIAPLAIGAIAGGLLIVGLGVYALVKDHNATMRHAADQKTVQTLSDNQVKMIQGGATPEQAAIATKAVTEGAAAIKAAEAKVEAAKAGGSDVSQWTSLLKTGGLIALGLGVLYIVAQVVPKGGVRSTAPATAMPLLENQRRRSRSRSKRRSHASGYGG
jgi:hypothetical protein